MSNKIKVVELFAGVGGFRIGLEGWKGKSSSSGFKKPIDTDFEVVWSNQFEPATKTQHASIVYEERFGEKGHSNRDIELVPTEEIPDHDLLVGGFPCQDYSVANSLKNSRGLIGKKGVLWWSIHRILSEKENKPKYLLLENVDRLLKSPAKQRGRDFAVMLKSLSDLGYAVEWRVVNAAEYGMPQRRRRVFFLGYHKSTDIYKSLSEMMQAKKSINWLTDDGVLAKSLPAEVDTRFNSEVIDINETLVKLTEHFGVGDKTSRFQNSGIMVNGEVVTTRLQPIYSGPQVILRDVLQDDEVPMEFYIDESDLSAWEEQKSGKSIERVSEDGFVYHYSEGGMKFPDDIDLPSRTIITGEGGKTPSRFKHIIQDPKSGKFRRLTPLELERLNMFPDNHTDIKGMSANKRAFFMGNALVVGVVEKIGLQLQNFVNHETLELQSK